MVLVVALLSRRRVLEQQPHHHRARNDANAPPRPPRDSPHFHGHDAGGRLCIVALSVQPTGPVYVCLLGEGESKLIPGLILSPAPPSPHITQSTSC